MTENHTADSSPVIDLVVDKFLRGVGLKPDEFSEQMLSGMKQRNMRFDECRAPLSTGPNSAFVVRFLWSERAGSRRSSVTTPTPVG